MAVPTTGGFLQYLPAVLTVVGWIFVFHNSRALARQSESNAIGNSVDKALQEISDENYKFWRDVDHADVEGSVSKCQVFQSYINFRCDFVENKIQLLCKKCKGLSVEDNTEFWDSLIEIVSNIRDISTMNSEEAAGFDQNARMRRILECNKLAIDLQFRVGEFLMERYKSFWEVEPVKY